MTEISIRDVRAICATALGTTVAELTRPDRAAEPAQRRYVVMAMMRRWTDGSLPSIAAVLGMKSHHTAGYGCVSVRERLAHQDRFTTEAFAACDAAIRAAYPAAKPRAGWSTGFQIDWQARRGAARAYHARKHARAAGEAVAP